MLIRKITKKLLRHQRRSCEGKYKRGYISSILAVFRLRLKGIKVMDYKCAYGKHYHIGHIPKNPKFKYQYFQNHGKLTLLYKD